MRVVHLGWSTCHAISGRGDKSTNRLTRGQAASFDNPLAKQIRILENKLEKAVMKVYEVR